MFGGLKCTECGNEKLRFEIGYTGADWNCVEGDGSGYGHLISLYCEKCGRMYTICHCRTPRDVSPVLGTYLGKDEDGKEYYAEKKKERERKKWND